MSCMFLLVCCCCCCACCYCVLHTLCVLQDYFCQHSATAAAHGQLVAARQRIKVTHLLPQLLLLPAQQQQKPLSQHQQHQRTQLHSIGSSSSCRTSQMLRVLTTQRQEPLQPRSPATQAQHQQLAALQHHTQQGQEALSPSSLRKPTGTCRRDSKVQPAQRMRMLLVQAAHLHLAQGSRPHPMLQARSCSQALPAVSATRVGQASSSRCRKRLARTGDSQQHSSSSRDVSCQTHPSCQLSVSPPLLTWRPWQPH